MKAIIYARKSTEDSWSQVASIQDQLDFCNRLLKEKWFELVQLIKEEKSAKTPWREWFAEMVELLKKWKAENIITWKMDRLARNPLEWWIIQQLLIDWKIKSIYTFEQEFKSSDNILISSLLFWMSSQFSRNLSMDVIRWMKSRFNKWKTLYKAPFGYNNVITKDWEKVVEQDEIKSKYVLEIFLRRQKWETLQQIADFMNTTWLKTDSGKIFRNQTIQAILRQTYYYWEVKYNWDVNVWLHKPIISKKLYDEVNKDNKSYLKVSQEFFFKWFIRWMDWRIFTYTEKKWYKYYHEQNIKWRKNIFINEDVIFKEVWKIIENYKLSEELKTEFRNFIISENESIISENKKETKFLEAEIWKIKSTIWTATNKLMEWVISDDEFKVFRKTKYDELIIMKNKLEALEQYENNIIDTIEKFMELFFFLWNTYKKGSEKVRAEIIKNIFMELKIDNKKQLHLKENELFKFIRELNSVNGIPDKDRTCVCPLGGDCSSTELRGHNSKKTKNVK